MKILNTIECIAINQSTCNSHWRFAHRSTTAAAAGTPLATKTARPASADIPDSRPSFDIPSSRRARWVVSLCHAHSTCRRSTSASRSRTVNLFVQCSAGPKGRHKVMFGFETVVSLDMEVREKSTPLMTLIERWTRYAKLCHPIDVGELLCARWRRTAGETWV